jgi:hypothetical protein
MKGWLGCDRAFSAACGPIVFSLFSGREQFQPMHDQVIRPFAAQE